MPCLRLGVAKKISKSKRDSEDGVGGPEKEIAMNLKKNLIRSIVLTTMTVIMGAASVLGADTRHAVKR